MRQVDPPTGPQPGASPSVPVPTKVDALHAMVHDMAGTLQRVMVPIEEVHHPAHYGGADNPYEAVKVIEAWELGFNLGNTLKYINRAGKKPNAAKLKDLRKAMWYLNREIENLGKSDGV